MQTYVYNNQRYKQLLDYCSSCGCADLVPKVILWMLQQYFEWGGKKEKYCFVPSKQFFALK